jgi:hypothetical protein
MSLSSILWLPSAWFPTAYHVSFLHIMDPCCVSWLHAAYHDYPQNTMAPHHGSLQHIVAPCCTSRSPVAWHVSLQHSVAPFSISWLPAAHHMATCSISWLPAAYHDPCSISWLITAFQGFFQYNMPSLQHFMAHWTSHGSLQYIRGMWHTSTALYFYGAPKKSLLQPRVTFGNMLFIISYSPSYYLQLLCSQFFSKIYLIFFKFTFGIKIVLFLKSLLYQFTIVKIVHLQNNTFTY